MIPEPSLHSEVLSQVTLEHSTKLYLIAVSFVVCVSMYFGTYIYSRRKYPFFLKKFTSSERADWCSRTASEAHSAMIVLAVFGTIPWYNYNITFQTDANLDFIHGALCLSLGYFLYDLGLVLITLMDQWQIFVIHHLAASTPLLAVLFLGCEKFTFLMAAFFLVEVTTVFVNLAFYFEGIGMETKKRYKFMYHFSVWAWIVFRLVMPIVLFYVMIDRMVLRLSSEATWGGVKESFDKMTPVDARCTITCSIAATLIILYSNLVWWSSMAPAYLKRLRARYEKIKVALNERKERKVREREEKAAERRLVNEENKGNSSSAKKNASFGKASQPVLPVSKKQSRSSTGNASTKSRSKE